MNTTNTSAANTHYNSLLTTFKRSSIQSIQSGNKFISNLSAIITIAKSIQLNTNRLNILTTYYKDYQQQQHQLNNNNNSSNNIIIPNQLFTIDNELIQLGILSSTNSNSTIVIPALISKLIEELDLAIQKLQQYQ